jgi:serine/threonine protein kinase
MSGEAAAEIIQGEGRKFGRYTLLYRFATGGMADVYLARLSGTAGFEKLVAIKAIHPHLGRQPQFIEMFIDEARLASRVSHPNVIHTLELGRVAETHFIAMEYVEGESLSALIRRGRPAPAICARIVADAAAGLHAAHELKGRDGKLLQVVHRDVSPTNILIGYNGAVKVADFGVARAQGMIHSTAEGSIKGKFAYMAPEQLRPEIEVDRRADVFALGIVLFEITTGRHLFRRRDNAATIAEVLHGEIARPSQAPGCQDYPEELERIVVKALQRPVEARYQSAHELQQDLERFIVRSGEPVLQADVGRLMQEVFADRIQEMELLLRETERHPQVVPDVETQSGSSMKLASVAKDARPRGVVLVAAGILALSLIVMVVLLLVPEKRSAETPRPPTRVQAAVPADAAVSLDGVGAVAGHRPRHGEPGDPGGADQRHDHHRRQAGEQPLPRPDRRAAGAGGGGDHGPRTPAPALSRVPQRGRPVAGRSGPHPGRRPPRAEGGAEDDSAGQEAAPGQQGRPGQSLSLIGSSPAAW